MERLGARGPPCIEKSRSSKVPGACPWNSLRTLAAIDIRPPLARTNYRNTDSPRRRCRPWFLQRLAGEAGGGSLQEVIKTLSWRLRELTQHKRFNLEEASTQLRFPALVARSPGPAFEQAVSAALQRKLVHFHYYVRGTEEHGHRVVSPQRVTHYREDSYLDSWDEDRQELRSFSVDPMSEAQVQPQAAARRPGRGA